LGQGNYNEGYVYDGTTGNLSAKAGVVLTYPTGANPARPHAVIGTNNGTPGVTTDDNSYAYDANGNMITRTIYVSPTVTDVYNLSYDAENRLTEVRKNNVVIATFIYDGDGRQVMSIMNGVTTTYAGQHYEIAGTSITKYYFAGTMRIALRKDGALRFVFGDHLGSSSIITSGMGVLTAQIMYKPWGEARYASGNAMTNYHYTGQRDDAGIGLYFYQSRFYDAALGRFTSPDSIIPQSQGVQAWDRYAFVNNNPLRYTDPTGHMCREDGKGCDSGKRFPLPIKHSKNSVTPPNNKQGIIYASIDNITSNRNIRSDLWLASKAEEGYDGWAGSGKIPELDFNLDVTDILGGIQTYEDWHSSTDFYNVNLEVNWALTASGTVALGNLQVNNNTSSTVAAVDKIIFSYTPHGPNDGMNDVTMYGSPDNWAGSNGGSMDMNIGVVLPHNQHIMIIQLRMPGAYPGGPFIVINVNPGNLHAGCSGLP